MSDENCADNREVAWIQGTTTPHESYLFDTIMKIHKDVPRAKVVSSGVHITDDDAVTQPEVQFNRNRIEFYYKIIHCFVCCQFRF